MAHSGADRTDPFKRRAAFVRTLWRMQAAAPSSETHDIWLSSDGGRLFGRFCAVESGSGAFLLLPGLGFHTFEYRVLQSELARLGWSTLALDYRGHGLSSGARGRWTLDLLLRDVRTGVDFLEARAPGRILVYGNSLGAMLAIAASVGDRRLVAVAASNCPAHIASFLLTPARRWSFRLAKWASRVVPFRISVGHFYSYADLIDRDEVLARIASDPRIADARRLSASAYSTLLEDWDGEQQVSRLDRPLLLLYGARDRLQPPSETLLLKAAATVPTTLVALDTGHLPNLEAPSELARTLATWASELALADRACSNYEKHIRKA